MACLIKRRIATIAIPPTASSTSSSRHYRISTTAYHCRRNENFPVREAVALSVWIKVIFGLSQPFNDSKIKDFASALCFSYYRKSPINTDHNIDILFAKDGRDCFTSFIYRITSSRQALRDKNDGIRIVVSADKSLSMCGNRDSLSLAFLSKELSRKSCSERCYKKGTRFSLKKKAKCIFNSFKKMR